jgi:nucleoside-diphosphate-sugar epimerase
MRVLLTGATGFLGAQIARVLVGAGCEVVAPVRVGSDRWRIESIAARLTIVAGDVCSEDFASEAHKWAPDICIHSAWEASAPDYLVSRRNVDLAAGTVRLALALRDSGCRRFVGIGTCFEYDTTAGYLSEKTRLGPGHLYSACKAGAALAVEQIGRGGPMSVAWARLFYLYGPFEPSRRLVPTVVQALLEGRDAAVTPGGQVRDFLHVEDAASALWAIALSAAEGPINVGSGIPTQVRAMVTRIGATVGRPELLKIGALPYAEGDPMFVCANIRRLTSECAWSPRYDLEEGLAHTIAWWRRR